MYTDVRVIVSMMLMCNAIAIVIAEHDGRRPGFSNAPVVMEYGKIEKRNLQP